ncbi:hypothetical protein P7228_13950 [Altererythrobacter arenosus]|uniref:DUF2788 domain-containing protein n=1 Tax=Altererythrobacter arenosus TaxID=3032592 RepID=A0ABY8FPY8_9SPHN|nr:hypothetical protein [Altererythrobacter sp. CAU 1644]WFL77079.1 hypothetical protein P7228_13950 [Altererythrobacter sp. CAU 1644]
MNEYETVRIVALIGWLILAVGALASYRMNWGKALKMGFTWVAIFVGLFLLFDLVSAG